jgi:hypothetical protein
MARVVKDSGWSPKLRRVFRSLLRQREITVGIHKKDIGRGSDQTNAQIGFYQEFGTSKIPQRSFLRSTFDQKVTEYRKLNKKAMVQAAKGRIGVEQALDLLGQKIASDVKAKIRSKIPPPNAPSTIKAKSSSTPLIDTAQLLNAIDSEVH